MVSVTNRPAGRRVWSLLAVAWLLAMSVLTVFKVAPQGLNADILLNTVMSLQKVTLYYWGQNRLLNVLPGVTAWLRDPTANLWLVLLLTAMSFYGLLYVLCRAAALLAGVAEVSRLSLSAFVMVCAFFVLVFQPVAIAEWVIGHIEYSLPALLLVVVAMTLVPQRALRLPQAAWTLAAIGVAMGLNPSTLLLALFVVVASGLFKRQLGWPQAWLAIVSVVAFLGWSAVSRRHGSLSYHTFDPGLWAAGLPTLFEGVIGILNLPTLLVLTGIGALASALSRLTVPAALSRDDVRVSYVGRCTVLFSVGWVLLFCGHPWVQTNLFLWRYFSYAFFAVFLGAALIIVRRLDAVGPHRAALASVFAGLVALGVVAATPTALVKHRAFEAANALTPTGGRFYAGDYWLVWPSVLRDMMAGKIAYGLTFRGEANREAVRRAVLETIRRHGEATVYCLNDTVAHCMAQMNVVAGPLFEREAIRLGESVHQIRVADHVEGLSFQGDEAWMALPATTGARVGPWRESQGQEGFLVYGPYLPLRAGLYRLSVMGESAKVVHGDVDVISDAGRVRHGKFPLEAGHGFLLREVTVALPQDVVDLQVRVWVSEHDVVRLSGYALTPVE